MPTNVFAHSSNNAIKAALKKISREYFPNRKIIGTRNRYIFDTINRLKNDIAGGTIKNEQLSQYIASSSFSHCFDGWNFLSRGIDALLNGDIDSCIHLVYYSELRAVMSLMACDGIGIFHDRHIYFDAANNSKVFKKDSVTSRTLRTHDVAYELYKEWIDRDSKQIIFEQINVNNRSLDKWINASGVSTHSNYVSSITREWFNLWGIDLNLELDQRIRNETSYRPHFQSKSVDISSTIDDLIEIWRILEPSKYNRFSELDKYLLRFTFERLFKLTTGRTIRHPSYQVFVNNIFDTLGESKTQMLYNFILRHSHSQDHILLLQAKKDYNRSEINLSYPLPMICRSILLLRFSTNYCEYLFKDSGVNINLLNFWWEELSFKFGITSSNPSGLNTLDLFTDISDSINILGKNKSSLTSIYSTNLNSLTDLCSLKQFHRVCFWGLGI